MKGLVLVSRFEKIGYKWQKTEEKIDALNIDIDYWKGSGFGRYERLSLNNGLMYSFVTVRPDGQAKVTYKTISYLFSGRGYQAFRKLDKLSDQEYKLYERRARKLAKANGINFDQESCFISSNDLHGFYFPNLKYRCISFINGKAYLLSDDIAEELGNI
jgi:hypothetical protein